MYKPTKYNYETEEERIEFYKKYHKLRNKRRLSRLKIIREFFTKPIKLTRIYTNEDDKKVYLTNSKSVLPNKYLYW